MLRLILVLAILIWPMIATADNPPHEVFYAGLDWQNRAVPAFDKGHLIFIDRSGGIILYGRDGGRIYEATVKTPKGTTASVMSAAIDTDGVVAATVGYAGAPHGYGGGIAFLDLTGKQTRFVETDRYMPAHICFAQDHSIWSFGWQRDLVRNDTADREDYPVFRQYSRSGTEIGQFIPRSAFPPGLSPAGARTGLWIIRAADDRIGALAHPNSSGHQPEWIELDLRGNLIGRWKLGARLKGGMAYTSSGRLFAVIPESRRLAEFDRTTSSWKTVSDDQQGPLLGADGNDLVFSSQPAGGILLRWFRPQ